ncbi:histidine kinase [Actinoplanes ianthinogenes]|uniref:Histidine kinase n=1 Tax=Actinoplanes ianthinogenes TaxID=122358 RepID=A0ABN6C5G8_9ACTN|nr:histidine kinase [Actinoplanes ianthinogenes]GGR43380.1 histidine kinase [Actinoplanes ianthinogenes]
MIGCLLAVVVILGVDLSAVPAQAARGLVFVVLLLVCAVAGGLFAVPVLGTPVPPAGLIVVAGAGAAGILLGAHVIGVGGFPWALPLAALIAAVLAGSGSRRWMVLPVGGLLAFGIVLAGSRSIGPAALRAALTDAGITVLCAAALYAQVWMCEVAERIERARRAERSAAVTGERQRFAAELHDIQGHHLQVIALKSELAERLAQTDPARALAEMRDVQALARQALGDTRELVQGYRAVSLETEIANAARVLDAAGIRSSIAPADGLPGLPPAMENLLGLVVRECTTNVLRHSAARRCEISLTARDGGVALRFANDAPLDARAGPDGGLAGLRERIAAVGGHLQATRTADRFTVDAAVPETLAR